MTTTRIMSPVGVQVGDSLIHENRSFLVIYKTFLEDNQVRLNLKAPLENGGLEYFQQVFPNNSVVVVDISSRQQLELW